MTPQTDRSRATRTLKKLSSFSFAPLEERMVPPRVNATRYGDWVGVLYDELQEPLLLFWSKGIYVCRECCFVAFSDITKVNMNEHDLFDPLYATSILVMEGTNCHDIPVRTVTGKYRDIFEVTRFLLRCVQDATGVVPI